MAGHHEYQSKENAKHVMRAPAEAEQRLKRLHDAIEAGVAELSDLAFKDRIDDLKAIRDQARTEETRARALLDQASQTAITPQMLTRFAAAARDRMRLPGGGFRRDHLRALALRVEVADGGVRIIGSRSRLLQTLAAQGSGNAVPVPGLRWR